MVVGCGRLKGRERIYVWLVKINGLNNLENGEVETAAFRLGFDFPLSWRQCDAGFDSPLVPVQCTTRIRLSPRACALGWLQCDAVSTWQFLQDASVRCHGV